MQAPHGRTISLLDSMAKPSWRTHGMRDNVLYVLVREGDEMLWSFFSEKCAKKLLTAFKLATNVFIYYIIVCRRELRMSAGAGN